MAGTVPTTIEPATGFHRAVTLLSTSEHLNNPHHQCKPIEWEPMHNLSKELNTDESVLKEISRHTQYKLENVSSDFGISLLACRLATVVATKAGVG